MLSSVLCSKAANKFTPLRMQAALLDQQVSPLLVFWRSTAADWNFIMEGLKDWSRGSFTQWTMSNKRAIQYTLLAFLFIRNHHREFYSIEKRYKVLMLQEKRCLYSFVLHEHSRSGLNAWLIRRPKPFSSVVRSMIKRITKACRNILQRRLRGTIWDEFISIHGLYRIRYNMHALGWWGMCPCNLVAIIEGKTAGGVVWGTCSSFFSTPTTSLIQWSYNSHLFDTIDILSSADNTVHSTLC